MPATTFTRALVAACYCAIYLGALAVAWQGRHGVGGGMAFTLPAVLGFPWTPAVVTTFVLMNLKPQPEGLAFIAMFVVPPALNVLTILFAGRRHRMQP